MEGGANGHAIGRVAGTGMARELHMLWIFATPYFLQIQQELKAKRIAQSFSSLVFGVCNVTLHLVMLSLKLSKKNNKYPRNFILVVSYVVNV